MKLPSDELISSARNFVEAGVGKDSSAWTEQRTERYECARAITALAGERDRLAAQVAELVALLKVYPHGDGCEPACDAAVVGDDPDSCGGCDGERNANGENIGGFCWEHRRRALLARIGATP